MGIYISLHCSEGLLVRMWLSVRAHWPEGLFVRKPIIPKYHMDMVMVINATFNNISAKISWQSTLLVEETGLHREPTVMVHKCNYINRKNDVQQLTSNCSHKENSWHAMEIHVLIWIWRKKCGLVKSVDGIPTSSW